MLSSVFHRHCCLVAEHIPSFQRRVCAAALPLPAHHPDHLTCPISADLPADAFLQCTVWLILSVV